MAKKRMRRCSLAAATGEMQIKAMMRDDLTPIRVAETGARDAGEKLDHSSVASGTYGGIATLKNGVEVSFKKLNYHTTGDGIPTHLP